MKARNLQGNPRFFVTNRNSRDLNAGGESESPVRTDVPPFGTTSNGVRADPNVPPEADGWVNTRLPVLSADRQAQAGIMSNLSRMSL